MSIIDKVIEKIKSFVHQSWFDDVVWALVIICVSFISFSFGIEHERGRFLEQNPISVSTDESAAGIWQQYQETKK